jgi:hypothetical protein
MQCKTPLCGKRAEFVNIATKEYKCSVCRDKRLDRDSISWFPMQEHAYRTAKSLPQEEDGEMLPITKAEPRNIYSVEKIGGASSETYGIVAEGKQEYVIVLRDESLATSVCAALNKAYKRGVSEVLHSLSTFSLDKRREHGILWGDSNTGQNRNY